MTTSSEPYNSLSSIQHVYQLTYQSCGPHKFLNNAPAQFRHACGSGKGKLTAALHNSMPGHTCSVPSAKYSVDWHWFSNLPSAHKSVSEMLHACDSKPIHPAMNFMEPCSSAPSQAAPGAISRAQPLDTWTSAVTSNNRTLERQERRRSLSSSQLLTRFPYHSADRW